MLPTARCGGSIVILLTMLVAAPGGASVPEQSDEALSSIPLYATFALEKTPLRSYQAHVRMDGSLHALMFSIPFHRDGSLWFAPPGILHVSLPGVPTQYASLFSDLGTPRAWPVLYQLRCTRIESAAGVSYEVQGSAVNPSSQITAVKIDFADAAAPISAHWSLRDGWSVDATILMQSVGDYLVPKEQIAEIRGHGYHIHTEMAYGDYVLNAPRATFISAQQ